MRSENVSVGSLQFDLQDFFAYIARERKKVPVLEIFSIK